MPLPPVAIAAASGMQKPSNAPISASVTTGQIKMGIRAYSRMK